MCAAENFNVEALELLLEHKADVRKRDRHGTTALGYAAKSRTFGEDGVPFKQALACAKLLLDAGADLHSVDHEGWTPLHEASRSGQAEIVVELLSRGADVTAKDSNGFPPLCWAAKYGKVAAVKALLAAGADVNATCTMGLTPLQMAADAPSDEVAKVLLAHGATPPPPAASDPAKVWQIARRRSGIDAGIRLALKAHHWASSAKQHVAVKGEAGASSPPPPPPPPPAMSEAELSAMIEGLVVAQGGMTGFSLSFTWPTGGSAAATHGSATVTSPSVAQLASAAFALQAQSADSFAHFLSDTRAAKEEADRQRLTEEEEVSAKLAMVAMARQKARAQRAVEDAQFDVHEAKLAVSNAERAVQLAAAGERKAVAEDELRQKRNWLAAKEASLTSAVAQLAHATNL